MTEKFRIDKEKDFSKWFRKICSETGANLMDKRYGIRGFYVHMPSTMIIVRKIYETLEERVEEDGHEPLLFPTLIPEPNLTKEKEHVEGFAPEVFWVTQTGENFKELEEPYALRPTGETAFYPMYSKWIRSYRNLPFKRYQSRISVYRDEPISKPFLRGREFLFFETHDVFKSEEKALEQIEVDRRITKEVVFEKLGIPLIYFRRPQWDKFAGAKDTYAADTMMPDGKANQLASTHNLGKSFAEAFEISYEDEDGEDRLPYQTCFGPGIWRIAAALIALHGDENGLILPWKVAPTQVVIVPITFKGESAENEKILKKCEETYEKLRGEGIKVKLDDSDKTPGEKFNEWDLKGTPLRIEIGPEELGEKKLTLVRRDSQDRVEFEEDKLLEKIRKVSCKMQEEGKERNEKEFEEKITEAENYTQLKEKVKASLMVKVPFCSIGWEGEDCGEEIKEDFSGKVRGVKMNSNEKPGSDEKCIVCGKSANEIVYISQEY